MASGGSERPTILQTHSPNFGRSTRYKNSSNLPKHGSGIDRDREGTKIQVCGFPTVTADASPKYDEQPHPTVPESQKRRRAAVEHSLTPSPLKRQRQDTSRERAEAEHPNSYQKQRHRRRPFFPNGETVNSKAVGELLPAESSHITEWVERVAAETNTVQYRTEDLVDDQHIRSMHRLLAEKKTEQRKRSSSSIVSSSLSDQGYQDTRYATKLEAKGSFMKEYRGELPQDVKEYNERLCQMLLEKEQPLPGYSLFNDDHFDATMDLIQDRNEAMINQTISHLMFPNVEVMAVREPKYSPFIQSVDEGWNNCKKITQTRLQPDSAVGFKASAFSAEQLQKLQPFLGDLEDKSHFRATYYMLFPFVTREVKRGNVGLDIADRQNAHSHTVALRGLVALFRLFGREQELHGKILTYSISHDHRMVRLYGHRPIIEGEDTFCWREEIDAFDFRTRKGRYRWRCRQFYLNALDEGLQLLEVIRSAIDDWTPDPALEPERKSNTISSKPSGLS